MELKQVILKNFRSYREETRISINDLTVLIGKNDIGKSSILEALNIFFENEKMDKTDLCVHCDSSQEIVIGCAFELDNEVVIDATNSVSLTDEYLLNEEGLLEIHKVYDCGMSRISPKVYSISNHPINDKANDLLQLKSSELKKRFDELNIDGVIIDKRKNSQYRAAIWQSFGDELKIEKQQLSLDKEDGKKIWVSLSKYLPMYALFQSDRLGKDGDQEIQDPMKIALRQALRTLDKELEHIKSKVIEHTQEVAERTLKKLEEINPEIAQTLMPDFSKEPDFTKAFNLAIHSDDHIPLNKRGSGVRRLILLSFFRAEAEKDEDTENERNIIFAVEEPETSQHVDQLKILIDSLLQLSNSNNRQVILTTHEVGLVSQIPIENIRLLLKSEARTIDILEGNKTNYITIASELGLYPNRKVQVIVCVEGKNDIEFLINITNILRQEMDDIPDLESDQRIMLIPLGGSTLKYYVEKDLMSNLEIPEFHIYDQDTDSKYRNSAEMVNSRDSKSKAFITAKRELENYLHKDAINEIYCDQNGFSLGDITDDVDVPLKVYETLYKLERDNKPDKLPWEQLIQHYKSKEKLTKEQEKNNKKIGKKEGRIKNRLNQEAVKKMTLSRLRERDPNNELIGWLKEINKMLK